MEPLALRSVLHLSEVGMSTEFIKHLPLGLDPMYLWNPASWDSRGRTGLDHQIREAAKKLPSSYLGFFRHHLLPEVCRELARQTGQRPHIPVWEFMTASVRRRIRRLDRAIVAIKRISSAKKIDLLALREVLCAAQIFIHGAARKQALMAHYGITAFVRVRLADEHASSSDGVLQEAA